MSVTLGSGNFKYEALDSWPSLPGGAKFIETPGVAVDSPVSLPDGSCGFWQRHLHRVLRVSVTNACQGDLAIKQSQLEVTLI